MRPFRYYLRVRYGECDAQKVVFNSRYGDYVDLAVAEFFRATELAREVMSGEIDYQLVKQTTEWRAPARFDDVVEASVSVKHVGTTSFIFLVEFRIAGSEPVTATSETVYVHVDEKLNKKPLSERIRAVLARGVPDVQVDHAGYLSR